MDVESGDDETDANNKTWHNWKKGIISHWFTRQYGKAIGDV